MAQRPPAPPLDPRGSPAGQKPPPLGLVTSGQSLATIPPALSQAIPTLSGMPPVGSAVAPLHTQLGQLPFASPLMGMKIPLGLKNDPDFRAVVAAYHRQMPARQMQPAPAPIPPPPPPRREPKVTVPKAIVNYQSLSTADVIAQCRLTNGFLQFRRAFEMEASRTACPLTISDAALAVIAMALKLRMTSVVEQAVWFAQRRANRSRPANRTAINAPGGRFALLRAENIIIAQGLRPADRPPEGLSPSLERLRNEAIAGIAAQLPGRRREDVFAMPREADDQGPAPGDADIVDLLPNEARSKSVTLEDVLAFLEVDAMRAPVMLWRDRIEANSRAAPH